MKTLKKIIIESNKNDELIDNSCVDEFIKYLQDKSIVQSGMSLDKFVVDNFVLLGNEIDFSDLSLKMKLKLQKARNKGRSDWWNSETCSISHLYDLYSEHTKKYNVGNEIDICNFVMFIWFRGSEINQEVIAFPKNYTKSFVYSMSKEINVWDNKAFKRKKFMKKRRIFKNRETKFSRGSLSSDFLCLAHGKLNGAFKKSDCLIEQNKMFDKLKSSFKKHDKDETKLLKMKQKKIARNNLEIN